MLRACLLAALALLLATAALAGEPSHERQRALIYLLRQDCGSCHGMTLKGGLGPSLLPGAVAGQSADRLAAIIVGGIPGTPMPPWGFEISEGEARWLARRLREGLDDAH